MKSKKTIIDELKRRVIVQKKLIHNLNCDKWAMNAIISGLESKTLPICEKCKKVCICNHCKFERNNP